MPTILVIEDDLQIIEAIEKTVTLESSFHTESVSKPSQAVAKAVSVKPDLILLDIRLPGGDGRHILRDLKRNAATQAIPVIFLTGMGSEGDRVLGLELGADDYVVKPFSAMELLARIKAVLRRTLPPEESGDIVEAGGVRIERESRQAYLDGKLLNLQPKEFELLFLFVSKARRALTRAYLVENSSSYGMAVPSRSVDTHIKNLRKKLGEKSVLIETIPKHGYRFNPDA
ncbi:MAG: DNA-binding response regulator [Elusimicrobia bacterium]|nr:MAG: DNA-binding response regulator [Elusimicrobiota bacterium]